MMRYSLLRIMLLFGCMLVLWLLGAWLPALRDPVWLLFGTAVTSLALSYFVLRGPREELARQLAAKVDERTARRRSDAEEEDLEVRRQEGDQPPAGPSPGSGER
jgi:antibiotic biosynthesis monooxygenase (ABM) superfamily enzyme